MHVFKSVRPLVFFPTFIILVAALVLSLVDLEGFTQVTSTLNGIVLEKLLMAFQSWKFLSSCAGCCDLLFRAW